jgi:hypothetical protein
MVWARPILSRILVGGRTRRLISVITHAIFMTFSELARHCDIRVSMAVRSVAALWRPTSTCKVGPSFGPLVQSADTRGL